MNTNAVASGGEVERGRQRRIAGLVAEDGPDWADRYGPGAIGCHGLLDRTALVADLIEGQSLSHPSCVADRERYALAERAATAPSELHQRIGADLV